MLIHQLLRNKLAQSLQTLEKLKPPEAAGRASHITALNARAAVFTLLLCQIAFSARSLALRTIALFSKSGHRERTSRSGSELRRRNRILRGLFSSALPLYSHPASLPLLIHLSLHRRRPLLPASSVFSLFIFVSSSASHLASLSLHLPPLLFSSVSL